MSFEELARRMNERAGGAPGMPVDVAELERKHDRFQAVGLIVASLMLTAVSVALNIWLAATGWLCSAGIILTVLGVAGMCLGVKQLAKALRRPRKVRISEARVVRPTGR